MSTIKFTKLAIAAVLAINDKDNVESLYGDCSQKKRLVVEESETVGAPRLNN